MQGLQEEPLLLRSRNGGVSFQRLPVPLEALKIAKGRGASR
jgi:hypothetical protein